MSSTAPRAAPEPELDFAPLFDLRGAAQQPQDERDSIARPDSRTGSVYKMTAELHFAVEVALTTGRPLLLRGDPGTGKSSLAPYVARVLGWRFYDHVVTSTSTSNDLLWRFDAIRRLSDAQAKEAKDELHYLQPGVLWWAFNRSAAVDIARLSRTTEPGAAENGTRDADCAVVLIDEIDKAHPDLPNGLLVALGANQIAVPHLAGPVEITVRAPRIDGLPENVEIAPVQVIITTNDERELPPAFIRRCITFHLSHPDVEGLVEIARTHFEPKAGGFPSEDENLARKIAERVVALRDAARAGAHRPSTAEFLDAFRACRRRGISPVENDERWQLIEQVTLTKSARRPSG
jgi:MoxR-like ATPase